MPNIKEIAPKLTQKLSIAINDDEAVEFAEALVAEVAKQNDPVARVNGYYSGHPVIMPLVKYVFPVGIALYTFPPTAEQIANETAEAIAKMVEFDTIDPEAIRNGAWKEFKK